MEMEEALEAVNKWQQQAGILKRKMPIEVSMSLFETPTLFFILFYLDTCLVLTEYHNKNILKSKKWVKV
jgi:hypothetical protein